MNDFKQDLASFPSPFIRAIKDDAYTKGESQFSVTQLLSPPQRTWLATKMQREESPYGQFHSLLGKAMHYILETYADANNGELSEQRMHAEIMGIKVSGQLDFHENKTIFDYKLTGGIQEKAKPEHYLQVQMNGYLAELNGLEVEHVAVLYIQRDWSYLQSTFNPAYPKTPFKIFLHPYEPQEAIEAFGTTVADHLKASLGQPRECTPTEQWAKSDTFALMKPDAKRASKVCLSMEEALKEQKPGQIIQVRKGEKTYCNSFCGFKEICPQFARENHNPTDNL